MARQEKKQKDTGFHTPFAGLTARVRAAAPAAAPPPPVPAPRPERAGTDADVFLSEMGGVQRLEPDPRGRTKAPAPSPTPKPPRDDEAEAYAQLCDLVTGDGPFDIADTPEYIEGIAHGLDRRLLRRLRRGDYAVQAHIDLHGLTADAARDEVQRFLDEVRTAGKRCVLIIHGRGLNSKDHIPVLKERLRLWLTRGRIGKSVLCFATAQPYDGGAGAVYVLLRR
ncbi:MAG TPA: Smr/MutS family protein [Polyangia bacterium]|jgi:DNA-nicking Smr family endonuclease